MPLHGCYRLIVGTTSPGRKDSGSDAFVAIREKGLGKRNPTMKGRRRGRVMCAMAGEREHVSGFSRLCGRGLKSLAKFIPDPGAGMLPAAGTTKLVLTLAAAMV